MDEKLRKLQRAYHANNDAASAANYIRALEQLLSIKPEFKKRVENTDETLPCLLCEKPLQKEDGNGNRPWLELVDVGGEQRVNMANPWQGVSVSTSGNYGSQVLDMHSVFFYMCDECIIRNSHKMLHYGERYDKGEGIQNAREYYEQWFKSLINNRNGNVGDSYMKSVSPYFSE